MQLQDELDQLTALIRNETSPRLLHVLDAFIEDLQRQRLSKQSLWVGETVENFTLHDQHRHAVTLYDLLNQGPVVLSFYRGGWCPYCNRELRSLHHALPEIEYHGTQLLAISPESPENIVRTVRKNAIDFPVLHDTNSEVARRFGIAVNLSEHMKAFYRSLGLNLSLHHADVMVRLPLPATYLIQSDYRIQHAFVDEDYTHRAEVTDVIAAIKTIRQAVVHSYG